jgi:hypothetical protein
LKKLFENWKRFLNEEQDIPAEEEEMSVAARMFDIDKKLPGEGHAGQNWNHNLADAFNMMSSFAKEIADAEAALAAVLANYDYRYWIESDKAKESLDMVREIDKLGPKLAQDIVKEAKKWKDLKEKITT